MTKIARECCIGGNMKMMGNDAAGLQLAAGETEDVTFNFAGAFCVYQVLMRGDNLDAVVILSWKIGAKDMILGGAISASIFSVTSECCPVICLDCVCGPGIPMVIRFRNVDVAPHSLNISLFGCYDEACPPEALAQPMADLPNRYARTYPR